MKVLNQTISIGRQLMPNKLRKEPMHSFKNFNYRLCYTEQKKSCYQHFVNLLKTKWNPTYRHFSDS